MKLMLKNIYFLSFLLAAAVCWGQEFQVRDDSNLLAYVPVDSVAVGLLNVEKALNSDIVESTIATSGGSEDWDKLQALWKKHTGMDLKLDLKQVCFFSTGDIESVGSFLVLGNLPRQKLIETLQSREQFKQREVGDFTIYQWREKGRESFGCFLSDRVALISDNWREMKMCVAIRQTNGLSFAKQAIAASFSRKNTDRILTVAANIGKMMELTKGRTSDTMVFGWGTFSLDLESSSFTMTVEAQIRDAEKLKDVAQAINGVLAMAKLTADQEVDKYLIDLINRVKVDRDAEREMLVMSLQAKYGEATEFIQYALKEHKELIEIEF